MKDGTPKAAAPPLSVAAAAEGQTNVVVVEDPFYIVAPSPQADEQNRVLKHGETFVVFDHHGDIRPAGLGEEGLYHEGTRFLSTSVLRLGKGRPLFLSSTVQDNNALLTVDLTNPDIFRDGVMVSRGTLHLFRSKFLHDGRCYERLRLRNYGLIPVTTSFALQFRADFADIFEVRGMKRERRGDDLPPIVGDGFVVLSYRGLDRVERRTRLEFVPRPARLSGSEASFEVTLPPQGEMTLYMTASCEVGENLPAPPGYESAAVLTREEGRAGRKRFCHIFTSNEQFNDWVNRSLSDVQMMITDTREGPYPYAGVPWFSTAFGRDGILTALECLWVNPTLARGVLGYLAAMQAIEERPEQDAEPGKILHETRNGEMAACSEIPFGRYYGSVDSTPLFVLLAGAYHERTGDTAFIQRIWPNVERALSWIDRYGDRDGDGFVEYCRESADGLVHQGWKDSHDSVFHADGTLAEAPIALCEVQGYVYAAKRYAANLAGVLGQKERASQLLAQAETLRQRFEEVFWCEDLSTYALALDGSKRPCRVRTSNAGQCLFTGIVGPERAKRVAQTLLREDSFSGWGIRTVAASEVRYNPMSYHNGSIWPHDNALIAYGLSRYRLLEPAGKVLTGLFDASLFLDLRRMPELFCGFPRRGGEGPTGYPVACSPQAWSAASVFMVLQACLGLRIFGAERRVLFSYPLLPESLQEIQITGVRVGEASVDLYLERHGQDVGVNVLKREGDVEVVVVK
ncbi:MAG: amylo-alpha-1,6-glucosidase [Planctomycetes bacterium]|nr:amylo-alpha-1,6-glucosidase [Planctomycetota bacterium]